MKPMAKTRAKYKLEEPEELFDFQDISHTTLPTKYIKGCVEKTHKAPLRLSGKSLSWKHVNKKEKKERTKKRKKKEEREESYERTGKLEKESQMFDKVCPSVFCTLPTLIFLSCPSECSISSFSLLLFFKSSLYWDVFLVYRSLVSGTYVCTYVCVYGQASVCNLNMYEIFKRGVTHEHHVFTTQ